ncbi:PREDICTED: R3H and coiled-coil domain-containing protein 1 [Diuraphis noxia]|uniref:R3H and coiled-coil domain-containing protein 1 n=1 Tax=Diuraphis noxia TaxID=143948 RepID=UPI000763944B|nr:PREDICTED: R3H and coiled-coil domain-containing protein 1 [Diuraphis noxia]
MESLDILNLRVGECSFLEIALADINHYIKTFVLEKKTNVVLIFPPLSARNRFLVHMLVQKFFNKLNTISVGSSYGRRLVVYHSSLKPMICETEQDDAEMHYENNSSLYRAYRTPNERKAQERLLQSLKPKTLNPSTRSHQRKKSKRPDIPIYIPKALRGLANNTVSNTSSTNSCSDSTPSNKLGASSRIQDDSSNKFYSKDMKDSISIFNHVQHSNIILSALDSYKFVDLSNGMLMDDVNNETKTSYYDVSSQFSDSVASSILPDSIDKNKFNSNSSAANEIIKIKDPNLEYNELESDIVGSKIDNSVSVLTRSENVSCINIQDSTPVNLPDHQISDVNDTIATDDILLPQKTIKSINPILIDDNSSNMSNNQTDELQEENKVVFTNEPEIALKEEHNSNCPHYCLDDSFTSGPLTDIDENYSKNLNEELIVQQSPLLINKSPEILETNEKKKEKKKKKKKKILDVDECSWEDMYDKEDDYIHPLLMKELVSTIGKVQVQCAKEDYRSYQTIEERSGDGECVIEVYGFSSDLKTIDLMNQFAAFRKNHFEIIWVDDTHALAVFESPNLADQALNTPLVLVKTRPLKNATKESKLRAASVVPLPATRPKTCTAMARRLVSSALGLKMNVPPDLINAERTLLANAKEKKIRDAQQKHSIWNNES